MREAVIDLEPSIIHNKGWQKAVNSGDDQ